MNALSPFGKLYGSLMDLRNLLYDRDILKSFHLPGKTYSVGNLTTGGTGKTPLVEYIAQLLLDRGEKICILTRGYGRRSPGQRVLVSDGKNILVDAETGGDEPVELARKLNARAVIVADADRVSAANWAFERFGSEHFILDDGFQHRRVKRDLDIVCIDATNPCGNGRVLPAGTLREAFNGLSRADAIVITRSDLVETTIDLQARLRRRNDNARIFLAKTEIKGLVPIEEFYSGSSVIQSTTASAFVFTAIGNSESFFRTLARSGTNTKGQLTFRDHHHFTQEDINEIERSAAESDADVLVTTAKDAVKLKEYRVELPCFVAIAEMTIDSSDAFKELITSS